MRPHDSQPERSPRRIALQLTALFFLALAIRAGYRLWRPPVPDPDQRHYADLARNIAEGRGYEAFGKTELEISPLFPALHAVGLQIVRDPMASGAIVAILIASLVPVAGAGFVGRVLGPRAGLLAGLLIAAEPHLVLRSSFLEPETLGALLYLWLATLLVRGSHAMAGVALGLACLTRPEALLLLPLLVLLQVRWRVPWTKIAVAGLLCLAIAGVFHVYLHAVTGQWRVSGKDRWVYLLGVHQWRTRNLPVDGSLMTRLQEEMGTPLEHIVSDPRDFLAGCAFRLWLYLRNLIRIVSPLLWPLVAVGFLQLRRADHRAPPALLFPLCVIPAFLIGATVYRHVILVAPLLLALAGAGAPETWRWARERFGRDAESVARRS